MINERAPKVPKDKLLTFRLTEYDLNSIRYAASQCQRSMAGYLLILHYNNIGYEPPYYAERKPSAIKNPPKFDPYDPPKPYDPFDDLEIDADTVLDL